MSARLRKALSFTSGCSGSQRMLARSAACCLRRSSAEPGAGHDELVPRLALQLAGGVQDRLDALLLAHAARVQEHDGILGEAQRSAVGARLLQGVDCFGVDPVGEEDAVGQTLRL
jgi:hypothetical protein